MAQLVEVQQLRGAVGGDMFCCLLTEEPPSKKESKFSFLCNSRGYAFRGENQFPEVFFSQRIFCGVSYSEIDAVFDSYSASLMLEIY